MASTSRSLSATCGCWLSASGTPCPKKVHSLCVRPPTDQPSTHLLHHTLIHTVRALLTSTEATPANVRALRDYVMQTAPQAAPFLTEEDLVQVRMRVEYPRLGWCSVLRPKKRGRNVKLRTRHGGPAFVPPPPIGVLVLTSLIPHNAMAVLLPPKLPRGGRQGQPAAPGGMARLLGG